MKRRNPRWRDKSTVANTTVSWGKYAGQKFKDVPTEYLEWFVENAFEQMRARKEWARLEIKRRVDKERRLQHYITNSTPCEQT